MKNQALNDRILSSIVLWIFACLVSACQPASAATQLSLTLTPTPTPLLATATLQPVSATPIITSTSSPTPQPISIWQADFLPDLFVSSINLPADLQIVTDENQASVRLDAVTKEDISHPGVVPWVYVLVAPFPTLADEVTLPELTEFWSNGPFPGMPAKALLVDPSTFQLLENQWGKASETVKSMAQEKILDAAWNGEDTWAIIPFEQLEPKWKVLAVDGQSPIRKDFAVEKYGLTFYFGLAGIPDQVARLIPLLPQGNRLSENMSIVITTGVTALVRGTASLMEGQGMTYPARDIGDWLREADILHISNEVPFAVNCPQPFDWVELVFCSQTEYIQLLESIGTDVVELTGDHFKDWGPEAMLYTLDLYKERGWKYYGGGANAVEASQPALFEHNGNRIAFTGCNAKEEGYSGANATTPGAIHCDFEKLKTQVSNLAMDGYLPIVTFQHLEYYRYVAHPILQKDFRMVADAGAVIVQGSQAHQPHAFEFQSNAFLHYGLGNLFFDQTNQGDPPRTAFIDRHVFYGGRHISTELLTIYFVDYARSRPMLPEERATLLKTVFQASGWMVDPDGK